MKSCRIIVIAMFTGVFMLVSPHAEVIGEIAAIKGVVQIVRDDEVISGRRVRQGAEIENYDLIRTLDDGELTILLTSPLSPSSELTIDPDTTFSLELSALEKRKETVIELLSGGFDLKVKKLAGDQDFNVRTVSSVMGVRGTSFGISTSPEGDILLACDEGEVEVRTDEGETVACREGEAIEQEEGKKTRRVKFNVKERVRFRRAWRADRVTAFRPRAFRVMKRNAIAYIALTGQFDKLYAELLGKRDIIDEWKMEGKTAKPKDRIKMRAQMRQLGRVLFRTRNVLRSLERVYFRLLELQSFFNKGFGKDEGDREIKINDFFKRFENERDPLGEKIRQVRHIVKMYSARNGGRFLQREDE